MWNLEDGGEEKLLYLLILLNLLERTFCKDEFFTCTATNEFGMCFIGFNLSYFNERTV